MEETKVLAKRIQELCKEKGITCADLAQHCNVSTRRMMYIWHGNMSNPNVFIIVKICKLLEISLDEFFDTDEFKAIL